MGGYVCLSFRSRAVGLMVLSGVGSRDYCCSSRSKMKEADQSGAASRHLK